VTGHRIYYVPPRLTGSISDWSGMDAPEGNSWLLDHATDLKFNAMWFSPMSVTSGIEKKVHNTDKVLGGSYYAARDHFKLDPEFSCGDAEKDREHLRHFAAQAKEKGISLYADLVFNHVAADHPLVFEENAAIDALKAKLNGKYDVIHSDSGKVIGMSYKDGDETKQMHFKFRRTENLGLLFGGPAEDPWTDVAQVNYSSPEARRYFVYGDENHKGLFKQVIDWHIDNGFTNFRCDAAYLIPPESWQELISYAHSRVPDTVFMAETLCLDQNKVQRLSNARITDDNGKDRPAFDLGMLGFFWWDFKADWMPKDEMPRVQKMSKYGGAGSPDTHDTIDTLAGAIKKPLKKIFNDSAQQDKATAEISIRNYALSALACNSSYMQMGYEFCNEKQNGVFKGQVSPADWDKLEALHGSARDIQNRIRDINQLKEDLQLQNCRPVMKEYGDMQDGQLVRLRVEFIDADTNQKKADVVLVMNQKPEKGAIALNDAARAGFEKEGLACLDSKPGQPSMPIADVRIFHTPVAANANAAPAVKRKAASGPRL